MISRIQGRRSCRRALLLAGIAFAGALPAAAMAADVPGSAPAAADPSTTVGDIVVTATRRNESLSRVPINITALTQAKMDAQGIRSVDDISRLTPDVTFNQPQGPLGQYNTISIRGVESSAGAATTGIYIDDTPVQARSLLYASRTSFPVVFDLDRVEILRGPQGTTFGASAEGGAIRFITPQPDLFKYGGYMRSEVAGTDGGALSYEAGAAVGGPIIPGVLAFRASVYGRRDGGYIDRVSPDTGDTVDKNTNYKNTQAYKLAFTYKPIDSLTITPGIIYQRVYQHDNDVFWEGISDRHSGDLKTEYRDGQPTHDKFLLPTLKIEYATDPVKVISNTSFFKRTESNVYDDTNYLSDLFFGSPYVFDQGDKTSPEYLANKQKNFTQELRLQSNTPNKLLDWTVGVFYAHNIQSASELNVNGSQFIAEALAPLVDGIYGETLYAKTKDEQIAAFANADIHITSKLKVQLGLRVTHDKFDYHEVGDGPINGGASNYTGSQKETPVTPKIGVSYQLDSDNMVYFSASKGYRTGGAEEPVPVGLCGTDLAGLGLAGSPTSYKSDTLWSYEAGAKNRLFGGRVTLDSSAYYIKWNNIQQRVTLPYCGFAYVDNLGSATSKGVDVAATVRVIDGLTLGVAVGYDDVRLGEDEYAGPGVVLAKAGDRIGGPPFVGTVSGDYTFPIKDELEGYGHVDYTYRNRSPSTNSAAYIFDPDVKGEAANDFLTLRVGVRYKQWDVSAFAKNLTNNVKVLDRSHDFVGASLFYDTAYRPLTAGVTVSSRF